MWNITMVVSYVVVDKQCAWQQDQSPEGSDGPHCGWVQRVDNQVTMCVWMVTNGTGGIPVGGIGEVTDMIEKYNGYVKN